MKYHAPKIQNETDLDGRIVSGIVRYVFRHLDLDGRRVLVKVKFHAKNYSAYQGRFYGNARYHRASIYNEAWGMYQEVGPVVPPGIDHLMVVRIGRPSIYPRMNHVYERKDSPGEWLIETWQHALVCITAHEGMHLRQSRVNPRGRRGRFNEVETEWAAKRVHDAWVDEKWRGR
jgi:hypothetical protein